MIIRRSTYNAHLKKAEAVAYDLGRAETPLVFVAARDVQAAREGARRMEHPNGDRGRAIVVIKPQDLKGCRGGVFLRGWGTDDELAAEARLCGMIVVDVFSP